MTVRLFYCFLVLAVTACSRQPETIPVSILYFVEQEAGTGPFRTRVIVGEHYLRIDEGDDGNDFLLYDRRQRTIYSLNSADKRTLVIRPAKVSLVPPARFEHRVEEDKETYPKVGGSEVTHYRLFTNGQLCYDLYAAGNLLPEALRALGEYRQALTGEQALAQRYVPKEMQTDCDLANNIFLPTRHLQHGFPIRQVDMSGRSRELLDYKVGVSVVPALFRVPKGNQILSMEEMRAATQR